MRLPITAALLALAMGVLADRSPAADENGFKPLFDGQSFAGWEGNQKVFRIEQGAIVGGSLKERVAHNDFLCTKQEYENFELRLRAKLLGAGDNAGIQFRSQRVPNHFEVSGYQADMGHMGGRVIWGWLYDESRRNRFIAEGDAEKLARVFKPNDWNDLVIRCQREHIQIWVNGLQTVDYTETDLKIPRRGIIGLQIHGGEPAEAWYKDVRIKELPRP